MYRVILVDDEPWALTGLEEILDWEKYGFTICARCTSATQALEEIARQKPDVVCTDIRMPRLSGIELISQVRSQPEQDVEFIIISAYSDFEVARKAINYGAAGYILKPLEQSEVSATVLRLKERLDRKRTNGPVALDLGDSKSVLTAAAGLPSSPGGERQCFILVTEKARPHSWEPPREWAPIPIELAGVDRSIWCCITEPQALKGLTGRVGWSLPRQSAQELPDMLHEALAAFNGGFTYSPHPITAGVQAYLGENFAQNISLGRLATHFFLSETYLCELFKKHTGCTVLNFLIQIRLSNACLLLEESHMSIKEIAAAVGFNDYSYFGRIFRRKIGRTPDQFRSGGQG